MLDNENRTPGWDGENSQQSEESGNGYQPNFSYYDFTETEDTSRQSAADAAYTEASAENTVEGSYTEESVKAKKRKNRSFGYGKAVGCGVIVGVIAGALVLGSFAIGKNVIGSGSSSSSETTASLSTDSTSGTKGTASESGTEYTVKEVAENCMSSVVAITNVSVSETITMFGYSDSTETESAGSGVIISQTDTELLIATNYHVIEDAETLTVCFNDSEDAVYEANAKGTDESNDLAVIAVQIEDMDSEVLDSISIATIGDSSECSIGDQVVAIGNALGSGQSVTSGYISALEREVTLDDSTATLLQTDAAINPGNSGGALFNMSGELIAINTAKYSDTSVEGMGFAIPMSTAQSILEELMTETTRTKLESGYGYLGIYGSDVDSSTASTYGIPEGVYVSEVIEDGAAEAAGIQKGDIITSLGGHSVSGMSELKSELQYYAAGEEVEVTLQRSDNGEYVEQTVTVTLGSEADAETDSSTDDSTGSSDDIYGDSGNGSEDYGDDDSSGNGFFGGFGQ